MKILFLSLELKQISGGTLYNKNLIAQLESAGHEVQLSFSLSAFSDLNWDFVIVDGILSTRLENPLYFTCPLLALIHVPAAFLSSASQDRSKIIKKERRFLEQFDGLIFVSDSTAKQTIDFYSLKNPALVLNPGRLNNICSQPLALGNKIKFLNIGRFDANKRQDLLVRTLASFKKNHPDIPFELTLCGPNSERYFEEQIAPLIHECHFSEDVSVLEETCHEKVVELYRGHHIYLCSSQYESWGLSICEALAHGLVIFNWAQGGAKELVSLGGGYQIAEEDSFEKGLMSLVCNKKTYHAKSKESLKAFQKLPTWSGQYHVFTKWLLSLRHAEKFSLRLPTFVKNKS